MGGLTVFADQRVTVIARLRVFDGNCYGASWLVAMNSLDRNAKLPKVTLAEPRDLLPRNPRPRITSSHVSPFLLVLLAALTADSLAVGVCVYVAEIFAEEDGPGVGNVEVGVADVDVLAFSRASPAVWNSLERSCC